MESLGTEHTAEGWGAVCCWARSRLSLCCCFWPQSSHKLRPSSVADPIHHDSGGARSRTRAQSSQLSPSSGRRRAPSQPGGGQVSGREDGKEKQGLGRSGWRGEESSLEGGVTQANVGSLRRWGKLVSRSGQTQRRQWLRARRP